MKLLIVSCVLYDGELIISPGVGMDGFAFRVLVWFLLLFVFEKVLLFVEVFTPAAIGYPVIAFIVLQNVSDNFGIFFA